MKKYIKIMAAAVLSVILILSGSVSAFAAGTETGGAVFRGRTAAPRFPVEATVVNAIDGAQVPDLFGAVTKNLAPGDRVDFTVKLSNTSNETVRFGMKATLVQQTKVNKIATLAAYSGKSAAKHSELLGLIRVVITRHTGGAVLYNGTLGGLASDADATLYSTAGRANIIGSVTAGSSGFIDVSVIVPETLGNEYQNTLTAVDWIFTVEADDPGATVQPDPDPDSPGNLGSPPAGSSVPPAAPPVSSPPGTEITDPTPPLADIPNLDEDYIFDEDVPLADFEVDLPKTGDESGILSYGLVAGSALIGLIGLSVYSYAKKKTEDTAEE